MDDRRETVYSAETLRRHDQFYFDRPGGREYARELDPDYIWLPRDLPVVAKRGQDGWHRLFEGPVSVWFGKRARPVTQPPAVAGASTRCFPGP